MVEQVNYDALDRAKLKCIEAAKSTIGFASKYGSIPGARFGGSANVFELDLQPFVAANASRLSISLIPEGLGTADDARPEDLSNEELGLFWRNIAIKTVSVMTNDAATAGIQSVLISLYLPTSTPEVLFNDVFLDSFLSGFVEGCKEVGCVYFSGETPQLKTKIIEGRIDIAGAVFGIVPPGLEAVDGSKLKPGDKIVFLGSSGPHENGFTALRRIASELPQGYRTKLADGTEYWKAINAASVLYTPVIQEILREGVQVSAIENITGHGWQKIMRSSAPYCYRIKEVLPQLPIYEFLNSSVGISWEELLRIFNCSVGMAVFLRESDDARKTVALAQKRGLKAVAAGEVEESDARRVIIEPLGITLSGESFLLAKG